MSRHGSNAEDTKHLGGAGGAEGRSQINLVEALSTLIHWKEVHRVCNWSEVGAVGVRAEHNRDSPSPL